MLPKDQTNQARSCFVRSQIPVWWKSTQAELTTMQERLPTITEIEERMRAMAPPEIPLDSFNRTNAALFALRRWKRTKAVSLVGGLLTLPDFHANGNRLDWLLRLIVSFANGSKDPTQFDLTNALNRGLGEARVVHREDPPEELFSEQIVTSRGNFSVFPGQWENPTACTQTVISAFEELPDGETKSVTLDCVFSLLKVSDAVARRAELSPMTEGGGTPFENMQLPGQTVLGQLARRVIFSPDDLREIGAEIEKLQPFVMRDEHYKVAAATEPGDSTLDYFPLLLEGRDIIVASPQNLTTAIRGLMIDVALRGGMDRALQRRLMVAQEAYAESGGFWPLREMNLSPPDKYGMRQSICQYEPGRYLHIIQVSPNMDGFPDRGFANLREPSPAATAEFVRHIEAFWKFGAGREDRRSLTTVVVLGGWGCPFGIAPPIDEAKVPPDWEYLMIPFADCATLGVAEDSHFEDIVRVVRQQRMLEADGFTFMAVNGLLNMFGYWRMTDGNFIPEHMIDIKPPCTLMVGTNELLQPRLEAARRRGYQALPFPDGRHKAMQRLQWGEKGSLREIYASLADVSDGKLSGAVVRQQRVWWIVLEPNEGDNRDWAYQIWNAVLQWLDAVAPTLIAKWPEAFDTAPVRVKLSMKDGFKYEPIRLGGVSGSDLQASIVATSDDQGGMIELSADWVKHLGVVENDAELELIVRALALIAGHAQAAIDRVELKTEILRSLGSRDWRWLHAREAVTVQDRMVGRRLTGSFKEISFSAHSIAKCGSIWRFRDRGEGNIINGEAECEQFLLRYRASILDTIVAEVRRYDRRVLAKACLDDYQGARVEQGRWRSTIKALRAISGEDANLSAFDRQNEINAVQRASKVICEITACEGANEGGLVIGESELAELYALALLIFGNGQLFSSIKAGLIKPEFRVSPTGDLLSEREIFSKLLRPGAEWMNRKMLDQAERHYGERREEENEAPEELPWENDLRNAVEAEYGVSAEGFFDLQFALLQMAEAKDEGVLVMKRSELMAALTANENYPERNPAALVDRLTLKSRDGWRDLGTLRSYHFDVGKFDRPYSLINRPLLALDKSDDPELAIAPLMVSDSTMYCYMGLMDGALNNDFWQSAEARRFAGARGDAIGAKFETELANKLRAQGLDATPRCRISAILNEKVPDELGDVDVLVVSEDGQRVWVVEAKNLKLCRTESEVAARLSQYRGRVIATPDGKTKRDKMLRHLERVAYVRDRSEALQKRLNLPVIPVVRGLVVVDAPQPMSLDAISVGPDGQTILVEDIVSFAF